MTAPPAAVPPPRPARRAVVLSGGGANGAYEVGVLKAVLGGKSPATQCQPLVPDIFAGTSIGSFNASFLVSQWDTYGSSSIGNLERIWLESLAQGFGQANGAYRFRFDPFELLDPAQALRNPLRPALQLFKDSAFLAWDSLQRAVSLVTERNDSVRERVAEIPNFTSFVSTEPWGRTIREAIRFAEIRGSSRKLRVAATNWTTGALRIFENVEMTDSLGPLAVMASSAIPGIFPPVLVGAEPHVDGGILMNTPLKLATDVKADELHVIYLDPTIRSIPLGALQSTLGTLYRQQVIAWANTLNGDIEDARTINNTLALLARVDRGGDLGDLEAEVLAKGLPRIVGRIRRRLRFRPLTIHRYHPQDELSGGAIGLLNLDREHVQSLIERGFSDAVLHDCVASGCVLPEHESPTLEEIVQKEVREKP